MSKNYNTRTASLKATIADIRNLDAKKINLDGKNILEYIDESVPTIKHANDTRETVTENDLWGQYIETNDDGTIIVHDDWVTNPNASIGGAWNISITKVEDNKAYTNDTTYRNIQTEKIKDGRSMFYNCFQLTSFTSDLSSLTFGYQMFANCNQLTSFSSDLSSLMNGTYMFANCTKLTSFTSDLSSLTSCSYMFYNCTALTTFDFNLSSLAYGGSMFSSCNQLISITSDLQSLTNGNEMFRDCNQLISITSDLQSLTDGFWMFANCTNLKSFSSDLQSLTNGESMFYGCNQLISFSSDLSSLTSGYSMFYNCTALTTFSSDLSNLTSGYSMFNKCNLDAESVMYIADTIKDIAAEKQLYIDGTIPYVTVSNGVYSALRGFMSNGRYVFTFKTPHPYTITISASYVGKLTLGINVSNNANTIQQQLEDFAKEATFNTWDDLKTHFSNKGWTVTFQYGGTTDEIPNTYDLRNREQIIPCPIFAKLVEADKDSAEYCTEDASTFYNIEWGHDVTDTSSYTQFNSLEDAMTSWNVFPKENIITTEE